MGFKHGGTRRMAEPGKVLIGIGVVFVVAGILVMMRLPVGRLPGDMVYRGKNTTVYFPLVTSVVVSVGLTILVWVVGRWRR